jgi:ubiquinone/menaquinone biosynthesis C-methylase UbiE
MISKENLQTVQYATSKNLEARIAIHHYGINSVGLWDWVWKHYAFQAEEQLLEVGCGTGAFWQANTAHVPPDMHITLTDFSQGILAKSRQDLADRWFRFLVADVERLPFTDSFFDHLLCHFMLYHATSPETAIREMMRVLKPGGQIAIITVSERHMRRLWDVVHEIDATVYREHRLSDPFNEENGEPLLQQYFSSIEKDEYEDTLQIDNVDVVIGYLRSVFASEATPPSEAFYQKYAEYVTREIEEQGAFRVFKRNVLYLCQPS